MFCYLCPSRLLLSLCTFDDFICICQLSQLLLLGPVLHLPAHLGGPPGCSVQLGHVLVLGSSEVNSALPAGSDKSWAEGKSVFFHCANSVVAHTA